MDLYPLAKVIHEQKVREAIATQRYRQVVQQHTPAEKRLRIGELLRIAARAIWPRHKALAVQSANVEGEGAETTRSQPFLAESFDI